MTAVQTFNPDKGKQFVAGLLWLSLPPVSASAKKAEIRKIAAEQNFDLVVQRVTGVAQVGFGSTQDGMLPGMLSAGGMMSKSVEMMGLGTNVLVAVKLDDNATSRWLYFAQRDGITLPEGDFIGTEGEVRRRLMEDHGLSSYETIVAPLKWGIPNSIEKKLADFYPKKGDQVSYKKWWALRPVKNPYLNQKGAVIALILMALIGTGLVAYKQWKHAKEAAELAVFIEQQKLEAQRAALAAKTPLPLQQIEHPWKTKPRALDYVKACGSTFKTIPHLSPGGWKFREVTCVGQALVVAWTKPPGGRIDYLLQIEPRATLSPDFTSATLALPLVVPVEKEEPLLDAKIRAISLTDLNEKLGLKMNMGQITQPTIGKPDPKNPKAPPILANWTEQTWKISSMNKPLEVTVAILDGKGFRIASIQGVIVSGLLNWSLDGVQYGNP